MQDQAASVAATGSWTELLDGPVARVVEEAGASVAMLYLLPRNETTLRLTVLAGAPGQLAIPWNRVTLSAPMPVSDAMRHRCLIWLGSQEELARRYPRPALVLPYRFSLAAAPIRTGDTDWGGLVLLWPGSHPLSWRPGNVMPWSGAAATSACSCSSPRAAATRCCRAHSRGCCPRRSRRSRSRPRALQRWSSSGGCPGAAAR